jgi:hypothetical protein
MLLRGNSGLKQRTVQSAMAYYRHVLLYSAVKRVTMH